MRRAAHRVRNLKCSSGTWAGAMPSSCASLRTAAAFTPGTSPAATAAALSTSEGSYPYSCVASPKNEWREEEGF